MYNGYKSRNQMYRGETVCKMGRATNYQRCSTIKWTSIGNGSGSSYIGRLVNTNSKISKIGDSGGPWFNRGYAYGIHQGSSSSYSYFTPIGTPLWYHGLTLAAN